MFILKLNIILLFYLGSPFPIRVGTKRKKSSIIKTSVKDVLSKPIMPESPPLVNHVRAVSPILDKSSPLYSPSYVKETQKMTKNVKNSVEETDYISTKTIPVIRSETPTKGGPVNGYVSQKNIRNEKFQQKSTKNILSSENFKNELLSHVNRTKSPVFRGSSPKSPSFRTTSPILKSKSPTFRTESPINKPTSPVFKFERVQSPTDRSMSPMSPSYRISTHTSSYKSTERTSSPMLRHSSPTMWNGRRNSVEFADENVDKSSNVKGKDCILKC